MATSKGPGPIGKNGVIARELIRAMAAETAAQLGDARATREGEWLAALAAREGRVEAAARHVDVARTHACGSATPEVAGREAYAAEAAVVAGSDAAAALATARAVADTMMTPGPSSHVTTDPGGCVTALVRLGVAEALGGADPSATVERAREHGATRGNRRPFALAQVHALVRAGRDQEAIDLATREASELDTAHGEWRFDDLAHALVATDRLATLQALAPAFGGSYGIAAAAVPRDWLGSAAWRLVSVGHPLTDVAMARGATSVLSALLDHVAEGRGRAMLRQETRRLVVRAMSLENAPAAQVAAVAFASYVATHPYPEAPYAAAWLAFAGLRDRALAAMPAEDDVGKAIGAFSLGDFAVAADLCQKVELRPWALTEMARLAPAGVPLGFLDKLLETRAATDPETAVAIPCARALLARRRDDLATARKLLAAARDVAAGLPGATAMPLLTAVAGEEVDCGFPEEALKTVKKISRSQRRRATALRPIVDAYLRHGDLAGACRVVEGFENASERARALIDVLLASASP